MGPKRSRGETRRLLIDVEVLGSLMGFTVEDGAMDEIGTGEMELRASGLELGCGNEVGSLLRIEVGVKEGSDAGSGDGDGVEMIGVVLGDGDIIEEGNEGEGGRGVGKEMEGEDGEGMGLLVGTGLGEYMIDEA